MRRLWVLGAWVFMGVAGMLCPAELPIVAALVCVMIVMDFNPRVDEASKEGEKDAE